MLDVAVSQVTTPRWELHEELRCLAGHGFANLALGRPKLSDVGPMAAAAALAAAGVRASSLECAGGFTGGDGRSFAESVADAVEAVEAAAILGGAAPAAPPPALVLHSGCRGGHTRTHATRLLHDALASLLPIARREGVVLALEPLRAAAAPGCSFLAGLDEALEVIDAHGDPALGIVLDLWHFGDDPDLESRLPRLAAAVALVQAADRCGPAAPGGDRLPVGHGTLPLERIVATLVQHGYRGGVELDPVGETVELLGYDGVLRETRLVADAWETRLDTAAGALVWTEPGHGGGPRRATQIPGHFRRAGSGAGSRRSQASSQAVSRG
ncbi:MAG: sugar phosphate isomerase/epimerase family protein [Planctomycetaceae bacterium]